MKNIFEIMGKHDEKYIIIFFENGKLTAELWPIERIWSYVYTAMKYGFDPLDLMSIEQNEYSLGKAEVYGLKKERDYGLGR